METGRQDGGSDKNHAPFSVGKTGNISRKFLTIILKIFDKNFERLHKPLYKEEIILHLSVDKEDNFVSINVNYANGTVFAPFYNPDDRGNNNLYKNVVKAYNKLMSNMKDIFEEIEDENY